MSDYRWLIEAPGTNYLAVREIAHKHTFHWTADHDKALHFRTKEQADGLMMAVRQLSPELFGFAETLGDANAVEHAWMRAESAAYNAALKEGRIIGRQEMKPLIRELLHMLDIHGPERDRDLADVFKRAQEVLEK